MNEAVFISDLHLHPNQPEITKKFRQFTQWAGKNTRAVYILGDFLHVWPGDDALDGWSEEIIGWLTDLSTQGVHVYFLAGNRDFLLGDIFLRKAKMQSLADPTVISLGEQRVLLSHGDRYCTKDYTHQWLRWVTRNPIFKFLFLRLSYKARQALVSSVRNYSQHNTRKPQDIMQTVPDAILSEMRHFVAEILIHGHTHQPGLTTHQDGEHQRYEYTLSDWDENPSILCYNKSEYRFVYLVEVG